MGLTIGLAILAVAMFIVSVQARKMYEQKH